MTVSISIIEDDAAVRESLAEWINLTGEFRCLSQHSNAEDALVELPEKKPAIALVDINLPSLSGIECVRRLKPTMPGTHFVMLTVYEDSNHIFDALRAGAIGYLLKQTPFEKLSDALRQVRAGGSPMTGYIARKVVQSFQQRMAETEEINDLSAREREVLELLASGYFYKEIAASLEITMSTVNAHVRNIYEKLHVHSRAKAIAKFSKLPVAAKSETRSTR